MVLVRAHAAQRPDEENTRPSSTHVPKRAPTVIISYGLWHRRFGADRSILGRKLSIEGFPRTVIGVMPPRFDFPEARTDVWMPLTRFNLDSLDDRNNHYLFMVGRLKPGM